MNCAKDIQKDLFGNIILCGGSALIPGFDTRMNKEICNLSNKKRQLEWLATRILLKKIVENATISYNDFGAPDQYLLVFTMILELQNNICLYLQ